MGFKETKETALKISDAVDESCVLYGGQIDEKVKDINVREGLNMSFCKNILEKIGKDMNGENGFKILFMGTFKNGKSTSINAFLGRDTLPVNSIVCTAVISKVVYSEEEDKVFVYKENCPNPEIISIEDFHRNYSLNEDDIEIIEDTNRIDRFKDVDYVELHSTNNILKDGVQLIDSPGVEDSVSRDKTTQKIIPHANAIVYVLDGSHIFSKKEKTFINNHFINVNPKPKNVFFLVSKFDTLNTDRDRETVKNTVLNNLSPVFTENGIFDENLYNNRVFFVDAYHVLHPDERFSNTNFSEFKNAIELFLTSTERIVAKYKPLVANLANCYSLAKKHVETNHNIKNKSIDELEINRSNAEAEIVKLEKQIKNIERSFTRAKQNIISKVITNYKLFIKSEMRRDWDKYLERYNDKEMRFGVWSLIKLANPLLSKDKKKQILDPMYNVIKSYIDEKINSWTDGISLLINDDIQFLQNDLKDEFVNISFELDKINRIFQGDNSDKIEKNSANKLQVVMSTLCFDFSTLIENAGGGNFNWTEFVKKSCTQAVIDFVAASIIGGIPGFIVWTATELVQLKLGANSQKQKFLQMFSDSLFLKYENSIDEYSGKLNTEIEKQFEEQQELFTKVAFALINDERKHQNDIINAAKAGKDSIKEELKRQDTILDELYKRVNFVYKILFDKDIEDIETVAGMAGLDNVYEGDA